MHKLTVVAVMFFMWPFHSPETITDRFWRTAESGQEYVLLDRLRGHHHDLVCGQVKTDAEGSSFDTARSQGASVGIAGRVETFAEAQAVVESDCGAR